MVTPEPETHHYPFLTCQIFPRSDERARRSRRQRFLRSERRVLLRARQTVTPVVHQQVQGHRGRGAEATVAARVFERVAARRRFEEVSVEWNVV